MASAAQDQLINDIPRRMRYGEVYRPAQLRDLEAMTALGYEAVKANAFSNMVISLPKIRDNIRETIVHARHYASVCEYEGEVVAAVAALTHPMLCYQRDQATVIQFYTRRRGCGLPLIRHFLAWARVRPAIKAIAFTLETRADPRIAKMLERLGFKHEFPVMMEVL